MHGWSVDSAMGAEVPVQPFLRGVVVVGHDEQVAVHVGGGFLGQLDALAGVVVGRPADDLGLAGDGIPDGAEEPDLLFRAEGW